MKNWMKEKKQTQVLLFVGVALLLGGVIAALVIGEEGSSLTMRLLGFASGLGASLVAIGAFVLIRRKVLGEARAADSEREMCDERGQMIALKAQNVLAFVAMLGVVALLVTALIRGDVFYMFFGMCICFAMTIAKFVAAYVYQKRL